MNHHDDRSVLSVGEGPAADPLLPGQPSESGPPPAEDEPGPGPALTEAEATSGRRAGWWRALARVALGGALVIVVSTGALVFWPLLWAAHPDDSMQLVNGRLIGETSGYIALVDREGQAVAISQSVFGWHPVVLTLNHETLITVQDREGGLGDLLKDMPVRVTYEMVRDRRLARSIEIGGHRTEPPPAPSAPPALSVTPAPDPAPGPVEAGPELQLPERPVPWPSSVGRRPSVGAVAPAPRRGVARPPATAAPPPGVASLQVAPGNETSASDPADGSAVIDWLLKDAQRR